MSTYRIVVTKLETFFVDVDSDKAKSAEFEACKDVAAGAVDPQNTNINAFVVEEVEN